MFHWTQETWLQVTQNLPDSTKILIFISLPKCIFFFKLIWLCNIFLSKYKSVYPKAVWDALKPVSSTPCGWRECWNAVRPAAGQSTESHYNIMGWFEEGASWHCSGHSGISKNCARLGEENKFASINRLVRWVSRTPMVLTFYSADNKS